MSVLNMLSPGVLVNEVDLTTIVPGVSTSVGAYAGEFNWGPVDSPVLISTESQLLSVFGKPTAETSDSFVATSFFSCANFLSYASALYVARSIDANSALNASSSNVANKILIKNKDEYESSYLMEDREFLYGDFIAKYPGKKGNGLLVSVCDSAGFANWGYKYYFDNAPATSSYVYEKTGNIALQDEMHIVVVDQFGEFSGKANTILEKFAFASKARDAIDVNGQPSYYKYKLNQNSNYVYALDPVDYANTANTWGKTSSTVNIDYGQYDQLLYATDIVLTGGTDGNSPSNGEIQTTWSLFADSDKYEISLMIAGATSDISTAIPQHILDNVILNSEGEVPIVGRRDAMLFVSPRYNDVVGKTSSECAANIVTGNESFLNTFNRSSSYVVVDSGWKYQFDRYNNVYRWIPLNADIAGLCAYTDNVAESWYSPAGFNRGKIKNAVKLAWNPTLAERDLLYKNGVNPVVSTTGDGVVLLGDKTLQAKPSAFDRINVRRLFITLEKAISRAAKYSLFEFNDAFTRAQFVAMVEPYLRTVQGRRGITAFKIVCDESNNTADIIDRNAFVGDIYIKPARSINFIQLNFVAVRTGVEFSTVVGEF